MSWCYLSAVSLGSIATGSNFTYFSGSSRTTVEYIFSDAGAVSLMSSCCTLPVEDLNTSDHVPIVANICLSQLPLPPVAGATPHQIDWVEAERDGAIRSYKRKVTNGIAARISSSYESIEDIKCELQIVTSLLIESAKKTLPVTNFNTGSKMLPWLPCVHKVK